MSGGAEETCDGDVDEMPLVRTEDPRPAVRDTILEEAQFPF